MTFTAHGSNYTFRGAVSLFPADNLASQYVGGYKCNTEKMQTVFGCPRGQVNKGICFKLMSWTIVLTYIFLYYPYKVCF